jgi:hypothetical protein
LANLEDWLDRTKLFDKLKHRFSEVDVNVKIFLRKDEWSKFSTVRQIQSNKIVKKMMESNDGKFSQQSITVKILIYLTGRNRNLSKTI